MFGFKPTFNGNSLKSIKTGMWACRKALEDELNQFEIFWNMWLVFFILCILCYSKEKLPTDVLFNEEHCGGGMQTERMYILSH